MRESCSNCKMSSLYTDKLFVICNSYKSGYEHQGVLKLEPRDSYCKSYVAKDNIVVEKTNYHEKYYTKIGKVNNFVSYKTPIRTPRGIRI